jgi:hypothetical protein
MKLLVCGSRDWTDRETIRKWLIRVLSSQPDVPFRNHVLVHGAARGADSIAAQEAAALDVQVHPYPADWASGKGAGPRRNQAMLDAEHPDLVLAFTDAIRKEGWRFTGTGDCVARAVEAGIRVTIVPSPR